MDLVERILAGLVFATAAVDRATTYLLRNVGVLFGVVLTFLVVTGRLVGPAAFIAIFVALLTLASWAQLGGGEERVRPGVIRGPFGLRKRVLYVDVSSRRRGRPPRGGYGMVRGWAILGVVLIASAYLGLPGLPARLAWPVVLFVGLTIVLGVGRLASGRLFRVTSATRDVYARPGLGPGQTIAARVSGTLVGPGATVPIAGSAEPLWRPVRRAALNRRSIDLVRCIDRPAALVLATAAGDVADPRSPAASDPLLVVISGSPDRLALDVDGPGSSLVVGRAASPTRIRPAVRFAGAYGTVVLAFDEAARRDEALATIRAGGHRRG